MITLSDDQWKVFELIAEEQPHLVVAPLSAIVAELAAMGLVATDARGGWITTPKGDMLYRDRQDRPLH
jgi:Mn-dependent DtxR family transcriptional regulator